MLHISALRGIIPAKLIVDERGNIPLPGDWTEPPEDWEDDLENLFPQNKTNQLWVGGCSKEIPWVTTGRSLYSFLNSKEKKEIYSKWCRNNARVLGRTMHTIYRWKNAIIQFQNECEQAEFARQTLHPEDVLKSLEDI